MSNVQSKQKAVAAREIAQANALTNNLVKTVERAESAVDSINNVIVASNQAVATSNAAKDRATQAIDTANNANTNANNATSVANNHNHNVSAINAGVLQIVRGGTGQDNQNVSNPSSSDGGYMQVPNSTVVNAVTNANLFTRAGIYISTTANITNLPSGIVTGNSFETVIRLEVISLPGNGSMTQILYYGAVSQRVFIRSTTSHNVWGAWRELGNNNWILLKTATTLGIPSGSTASSNFLNVGITNPVQFTSYAIEVDCVSSISLQTFIVGNANSTSTNFTAFELTNGTSKFVFRLSCMNTGIRFYQPVTFARNSVTSANTASIRIGRVWGITL